MIINNKEHDAIHISLWVTNYLLKSNEFCKDLQKNGLSYSDFECNSQFYFLAKGLLFANDKEYIVPSITAGVFRECKRIYALNSIASAYNTHKGLFFDKKYVRTDSNGNVKNELRYFALDRVSGDIREATFFVYKLLSSFYDVKRDKKTGRIVCYSDDQISFNEKIESQLKDCSVREIF